MSDDTRVNIDDAQIGRLMKALSKPVVIRVGILGNKNSRSGHSDSNATVGAAHEFGTSRMPRRSFLLDPLKEKLSEYVEKSGVFTDEITTQVMKDSSAGLWIRKLAAIAESVVLDAFKTNGFGRWAPWKSGYTNNTGSVLVDTQQLRNSITSDVKAE